VKTFEQLVRVVFVSLASVTVVFLVLPSINWGGVSWGTVPEWIGALALVALAVAVRRIAARVEPRQQYGRDQHVDIRR
jgi:hypothetical protein